MINHGLLATEAPTYVTQSQIRLLHQPILTDLIARQGEAQVRQTLLNVVAHLRAKPISTRGYGPGNLLNLLITSVTSGETLHIFRSHTGFVMSVAVSTDGRWAASGGFDETVRLWDLNSGECLRVMRAERPYEGMNIAGAKGLGPAQIASLKALGAVERF